MPPAAAEEMWQQRRYNHKDSCTSGIWVYLCHPCVCVLPDGVAPLSAAVFCFHTLHTGCSTCRSHSRVKTVWKDKAQRRCMSPGVLWLREAVMPITAPAGPPITDRRAHAEDRPEKTSKQDNNRQPSLNLLVTLSLERFPVTLFKQQVKTHPPSPTISKYDFGVLLCTETGFQQISSEWEACVVRAARAGGWQPGQVRHCVACHFWVHCCSTSREINGISTGEGRPVE